MVSGVKPGRELIMTDPHMTDGAVKFLRFAAILVGVGMIVLGLLADRIGLSAADGMSRNQVLILVTGTVLVLSGIMGRRFPGAYRLVAVCLLNTIVVIVILELASVAAIKLFPPESFLLHARKVQEGHLDAIDASAVHGVYVPFVVWRGNPLFNNDSVTVSEDGFRVVPGSSGEPEAYSVFLFGGSAMWGLNVSDRNTIPAYLQTRLDELMDRPVAVRNFAQIAHSSSQEMVELVIQLRNGNIPDAVIFYDGFNDVWGAYESGAAGGHFAQRLVAARVMGMAEAFDVPDPFAALFQRTNIGILTSALRGRINQRTPSAADLETYATMGVPVDELASDVVDTYLGTANVVRALGEHYRFSCTFVLQPSIWYGDKPLTEYERDVLQRGDEFFLAGSDPAFRALFTATYDRFQVAAENSDDFLSYTGVFSDVHSTVYNDYSGAHIEPFANAMIADLLASELTRRAQGSR